MGRAPGLQRGQVQQLQHVQVQQVEEHRRCADIGQRPQRARQRRPLIQPQQQQAHAKGQQQELQRGRILGDVEHAHPRAQRGLLVLPGRIAIVVGEAQQGEGGQRAQPGPQQALPALFRVAAGAEPRRHQVAQRDHPDPRQHRVGGTQAQ
ncbi:hypothetical protein D3C81_970510 [compost metagenome]